MVTLSRVITSCAGISMVRVRRSTLIMRSMYGTRMIRPGPRAPASRPSRKTTPRSYSCTTLIVAVMMTRAMTTKTPRITQPAISNSSRGSLCRLSPVNQPKIFNLTSPSRRHDEGEPLHTKHPHRLPRRNGSGNRARPPELTVDQNEALRLERAAADRFPADQRAQTSLGGPGSGPSRRARQCESRHGDEHDDRPDDEERDIGRLKEEERAQREAGDAGPGQPLMTRPKRGEQCDRLGPQQHRHSRTGRAVPDQRSESDADENRSNHA